MSQGVDIGRKLTLEEISLLADPLHRYTFVARYLDGSHGLSAKAIDAAEAGRILSRRLGIVLVFETTGAGPWTYDQGKADGAAARADAIALGAPLGIPVCLAVDKDVVGSVDDQLLGYVNGFYDGLDGAYALGIYAEYDVVRHANENWPGVSYLWQTYAWSGGAVYIAADVYQHTNGVTVRPGLEVDENIALTPVAWRLA